MNRRDFLRKLGLLFGSSLGAELVGSEFGARVETDKNYATGGWNGHRYTIEPWSGDNFQQGHLLRDGKIYDGEIASERDVDFVILGGGIAGLCSAYYLRNYDFILLEQYEKLGGQARGGSHNGLNFSYGGSCIRSLEGDLGQLLSELSLKAARLETSQNSWHLADHRDLV